jgi:hypothetical protein
LYHQEARTANATPTPTSATPSSLIHYTIL